MTKKQTTNDRLLTEVELELMSIVWQLGSATVKDVSRQLPKSRQLAYTTVATVMKILEQKGFLSCKKDSYAHVFFAKVSKQAYESTCLDHIVENVFDGEPVSLVHRLLEAKTLKASDIAAIEKALQELSSRK